MSISLCLGMPAVRASAGKCWTSTRKKLEEYEHPRLSVLDTNARAIALYRRMGWKFIGEKDMEFDPAEYPSVVKKCALLWMQYEG